MKRCAWRRTSASVSQTTGSSGWPADDGVEAVAPGRLRDRPRGQLDEVERVAGERLDRAVERARAVVGLERERDPPVGALAELRPVRDRDEAGEGLRVVADVGREHDEPVQRRRSLARDRDLGRVGVARHLGGGVGGRAGCDRRRRRQRGEQAPALVERDRVRADDPDLGSGTSATPTRKCRIGRIACALIDVAESTSRSCVSATGPEIELSIGSTPPSTRPEATAATTSENDGSACASSSGKRSAHAAALCAPSRPG